MNEALKIGCLYRFKRSMSMFCWTEFKNLEYLTGVQALDVKTEEPFIVIANGPVMEPEYVRVIYRDQLIWIRVNDNVVSML